MPIPRTVASRIRSGWSDSRVEHDPIRCSAMVTPRPLAPPLIALGIVVACGGGGNREPAPISPGRSAAAELETVGNGERFDAGRRDEIGEPPLVFTRLGMGVRFQVALTGEDEESLAELAERCFGEVERLEGLLSNWSPASAISRLNADGSAGRREIDPELAEVLQTALDFCAQSNGAFDVTVGALLRALGFYDQKEVRALAEAELDALRARTGCRLVSIVMDGAGGKAFLERSVEGIEIDLSGVAKGWAVERVVDSLRRSGVSNAFVAAGPSTAYGLGPGPEGRGWPFSVPARGGGEQTWHLWNEAVATSGRLSATVDVEGAGMSYIIDPSTGQAVDHSTRMTVFRGPSAVEADMASTALLVMGPEEAARWFASRGDWAAERTAILVSDPMNSEASGAQVAFLGRNGDG